MLKPPEPSPEPRSRTEFVTFGAACHDCDHGHDGDPDPRAVEDRMLPDHGDHEVTWGWQCECGRGESAYCSLVGAMYDAYEHDCPLDVVINNVHTLPDVVRVIVTTTVVEYRPPAAA